MQKKFTLLSDQMEIEHTCPYCRNIGQSNFEESCAAGFEVVRCDSCHKLYAIEWASAIECRSGKIDFPEAPGFLLSGIYDGRGKE